MPIDAGDWGIPELDVTLQPRRVAGACRAWERSSPAKLGTPWFHFYENVSENPRVFAGPERVLGSGCVGCVEPPLPSGPGVSRAEALFGVQRKRALASRWLALGLGVLVDLSVDDRDLDLALLGVPAGWRSYAVRARRVTADWVAARHALARARAGAAPVLVVVGGGTKMRAECRGRGWRYVPADPEFRFRPRPDDHGWTPEAGRVIMESADNPVPDEPEWTPNFGGCRSWTPPTS